MAIATTNSHRISGRRPGAPRRKMGTWKMAYADFLTALMAFFLMMWLVSGVSPASRTVIADYFTGQAATTPIGPLVAMQPSASQKTLAELRADPALVAAGDSVRLARDPEGVRIDLVDRAARPLFASDSGALTPAGFELTRALARALTTVPGPLTIEGHTDAFPAMDPNRSNWDISSERANTARRVLSESGIPADRVRAVTGLADTQPLNQGEPHLSANRRISILIHSDG